MTKEPEIIIAEHLTSANNEAPKDNPTFNLLGINSRGAKTHPALIKSSFILFLLYTLYLAQGFFIPLMLAIFLRFLLMPGVRTLSRLRIPVELGSFLMIGIFVGTIILAGSQLAKPAQEWMTTLPSTLQQVKYKVSQWRAPVNVMSKTAKTVQDITTISPTSAPEVSIRTPSILENLMSGSKSLLYGSILILTLLYGMLAHGDRFLSKLSKVIPESPRSDEALRIGKDLERNISSYLLTIAAINVGLAIAQTAAMYLVGMPNPLLWGVLIGLLNFIPIIGPLTGIAVVGLVSLLNFNTLPEIILAPAVAAGIIAIESTFVNPYLLSRRFSLNVLVMLTWIVLWGWMWGIAGTLMAVPMLTTLKILFQNISSLKKWAAFVE